MKRIVAVFAVLALCFGWVCACAQAAPAPAVDVPAALLMEKETGTILFEENAHEKREPASVTKIMTMLLVMEAIDSGRLSYDDTVTVSAHAASMGGSQVYMKENECMSVRDMLKAVAVVSANDGSVALGEHLAGSEEAFAAMMNQRAKELGMNDTHFVNCTGLPAEGHVTSAHDIAVMSRELMLRHPDIRQFTTIWMDTIRDGAFQLSNTNKLVRFYEGATGLKTGFTDTAKYCLSATAERSGMELIAVVMGGQTSEQRFEAAKSLLNFGFANYTLVDVYPDQALPPVEVLLGEEDFVQPVPAGTCRLLVDKADVGKVTQEVELAADVQAPVESGQRLGRLSVCVDGVEQQVIDLVADRPVVKLTVGKIFMRFLDVLFMKR